MISVLRHLSVFDRCAKTSGCLMPSKFTRTKHRKLSHRCLPLFVTQIKYNCNYNWNISALSHSQSASAVFLSTTHAFCTFSWAVLHSLQTPLRTPWTSTHDRANYIRFDLERWSHRLNKQAGLLSSYLLIIQQDPLSCSYYLRRHTRVWTHVHTSTQSGSFKRLNVKNSKTWQHVANPVLKMLC